MTSRTAVLERLVELQDSRILKTEDAIQELRREAHEMRTYWRMLGAIVSIAATVLLTLLASK